MLLILLLICSGIGGAIATTRNCNAMEFCVVLRIAMLL